MIINNPNKPNKPNKFKSPIKSRAKAKKKTQLSPKPKRNVAAPTASRANFLTNPKPAPPLLANIINKNKNIINKNNNHNNHNNRHHRQEALSISISIPSNKSLREELKNQLKKDAKELTDHSVVEENTRIIEKTWEQNYLRLLRFYQKHGHSNVLRSDPDKQLSGWVKRQRNNLKDQKLSESQIRRLNNLGFVWNRLEGAWYDKYDLLVEYASKNGSCEVPTKYNRSLAEWTQRQRREYRNQAPTMTPQRKEKLSEIPSWSWDSKAWSTKRKAIASAAFVRLASEWTGASASAATAAAMATAMATATPSTSRRVTATAHGHGHGHGHAYNGVTKKEKNKCKQIVSQTPRNQCTALPTSKRSIAFAFALAPRRHAHSLND
mmetsp:Transcript_17624/g.48742  ORF Transcript_17624/g.48742 Transcript_17624/m.48742 type:complete len:379 (+) Transcript_17624:639-1775(+)